jgi:hypothetical protein
MRIGLISYSSPSALRAPPQGGHTLIGLEQCHFQRLPPIIRYMQDNKCVLVDYEIKKKIR